MKKNSQAFINQLLVCLIVTFGFSGSIGLGTVWMRHQISVTANSNKILEGKITEMERRISESSALIESEQSISKLRERNRDWKLGLDVPQEKQSVWIDADPDRLLAAKRNRDLFNTETHPPTSRITFAAR